jgi:hypothetical protein
VAEALAEPMKEPQLVGVVDVETTIWEGWVMVTEGEVDVHPLASVTVNVRVPAVTD